MALKKIVAVLIVVTAIFIGVTAETNIVFAADTMSEVRRECQTQGTPIETNFKTCTIRCKLDNSDVIRDLKFECEGSGNWNPTEQIQRKREECEANGGTFRVNSVSSGYIDSSCIMSDGSGTTPSNNNGNNTTTVKNEVYPSRSACIAAGGTFVRYEDDEEVLCQFVVSDGGGGGSSSGNGAGGSSSGSASGGGYIADGSDYVSVEVIPSGFNGNMDNSVGQKDTKKCPEGQVDAGLFGGCVDASEGGIFMILNLILNVLTWGICIAGTLGIVITGIQYMTARDNAAQMEKAKHRLIQIVIGLAIYAVMWAFLQWLLPGGVFGS